MILRWTTRLVVAALVAATGAVGHAAPAAAALCGAGQGVSVVVDYKALGGGIVRSCASGGGGKAAALSQRAGVALTQAAQEPGFVCRVNGKPANDPCQRASSGSAYWGLYWSSGNGRWTYSSRGAYSLDVPSGGFVGWAFQGSGGSGAPGVSPTAPAAAKPTKAPAAKPTKAPAAKPTRAPAAKPTKAPASKPASTPSARPSDESSSAPQATTGSSSPSARQSARASARASASASAEASSTASAKASAEASASSATTSAAGSPSASPTDDAQAALEPTSVAVDDDQPEGLPLWVPLGVLVLLAAGGGGAVWWRRRQA